MPIKPRLLGVIVIIIIGIAFAFSQGYFGYNSDPEVQTLVDNHWINVMYVEGEDGGFVIKLIEPGSYTFYLYEGNTVDSMTITREVNVNVVAGQEYTGEDENRDFMPFAKMKIINNSIASDDGTPGGTPLSFEFWITGGN